MNKEVVCLYPEFGVAEPLRGLYLRRDFRADGDSKRPFVYANFLSSLDGRIAWRDSEDENYQLPELLKSDEDFRLFLELYAHADCIVTHAGYMRSLAAGRLGNVLQLPQLAWTEDIHAWRRDRGLPVAPDVVIISSSLEFPWHGSLDEFGQNVHIATGARTPANLKQAWVKRGHKVYELGASRQVDAKPLIDFVTQKGYQSVYLVAGPQLLQELLIHSYVDRFFMTVCHQLLGGWDFQSLVPEHKLGDKGKMQLQRLYMDHENSSMLGQWYAEFSAG